MALSNPVPRSVGISAAISWREVWQRMPCKWLFFSLLAAWVALFHFIGNSTLGYVNTSSVFGWWFWVMTRGLDDGNYLAILSQEEAHAWLMPMVVIGLIWWKREEWLGFEKRVWWPALILVVLALALHFVGFLVQQTRISLVGFFIGLYALSGWVWGWNWMKVTVFPFSLFAFCVPLGTSGEFITFPLRMLATKLSVLFAHTLLGINVIQNGSSILDPAGRYHYEVAAACSGIRSLTAILALSVIYGYAVCQSNWRRLLMSLAAVPLAVAGNVLRLLVIIIAAEAFGQKAGNYVHASDFFSIIPYIPGIGGLLLLGHWLREDKAGSETPGKDRPPVAEVQALS